VYISRESSPPAPSNFPRAFHTDATRPLLVVRAYIAAGAGAGAGAAAAAGGGVVVAATLASAASPRRGPPAAAACSRTCAGTRPARTWTFDRLPSPTSWPPASGERRCCCRDLRRPLSGGGEGGVRDQSAKTTTLTCSRCACLRSKRKKTRLKNWSKIFGRLRFFFSNLIYRYFRWSIHTI